MNKPEVIVVGAGPGGLAATHALLNSGLVNVTLIQKTGNAHYLPGILPVLLGLRPVSQYYHPVTLPQVHVIAGEVTGLAHGNAQLADGTTLTADAVIAAPGLSTDATSMPVGQRSFPVWELAAAAGAQHAIHALTSGRLVVAIAALPYRCPPAPYGLAISLKALFQAREQPVEVILVTPEERPLQALGERVSNFLESLVTTGQVTLETAFHMDNAACRDGMLVAADGRHMSYDLGLFVPPHRRPTFLDAFPGNGALVQVDAQQRTAMDRIWVVGDVAATTLPRAAGAAEAQGRTAAASILATLGLAEPQTPVLPTPNCYIWTGQERAARIQLHFPHGLPPQGKPEISLDAPDEALLADALNAPLQWQKQLRQ
ncbi:MAG TPA: FAD-dependent oxidoreductase [Ktedonobacteraceae bacterium]|nr:FAD-dependent oxidoreductase [Ktedonobacteraceae bacterium]